MKLEKFPDEKLQSTLKSSQRNSLSHFFPQMLRLALKIVSSAAAAAALHRKERSVHPEWIMRLGRWFPLLPHPRPFTTTYGTALQVISSHHKALLAGSWFLKVLPPTLPYLRAPIAVFLPSFWNHTQKLHPVGPECVFAKRAASSSVSPSVVLENMCSNICTASSRGQIFPLKNACCGMAAFALRWKGKSGTGRNKARKEGTGRSYIERKRQRRAKGETVPMDKGSREIRRSLCIRRYMQKSFAPRASPALSLIPSLSLSPTPTHLLLVRAQSRTRFLAKFEFFNISHLIFPGVSKCSSLEERWRGQENRSWNAARDFSCKSSRGKRICRCKFRKRVSTERAGGARVVLRRRARERNEIICFRGVVDPFLS